MNICQILLHTQCVAIIEGLWKVCLAKILSFLLFHSVVRNDPNALRPVITIHSHLGCLRCRRRRNDPPQPKAYSSRGHTHGSPNILLLVPSFPGFV